MKQRAQSTIDALILIAASHDDFGITKVRLTQELVLRYRMVNQHCEQLVQKRMLDYDPVTRTYHVTHLGEEMIKLIEDLANHYTPVNNVLTKYKARLEAHKLKTSDHVRRIMKESYTKASLSTLAASPLLTIEQLFIQLNAFLAEPVFC
jgi:predicted transcriptional regulator